MDLLQIKDLGIYSKKYVYCVLALTILEAHSTPNPINSIICANYMKVNVNGKIVELPKVCASHSNYTKSHKSGIRLNTEFFQQHENLTRWGNINTEHRQNKILSKHDDMYEKYNILISDINFWWDGHVWTPEERESALSLQENMQGDFLSDVVVRRDVTDSKYVTGEFNDILDDLLDRTSKKIKCPSISMKTSSEVFRKQLELIHEKEFQRFNVDWTGMTVNDNWEILSSFLKDKKIWCNMTAINKTRSGNMKSYMMLGIAYGAHTVGLGYLPFSGTDTNYEQKSYLIDDNTLCYNEVQDMTPEVCDTTSHNILHQKSIDSHPHIRNDSFYNFIPKNYT